LLNGGSGEWGFLQLDANKGSMWLAKHWAVDHNNAWAACFCCPTRKDEQLAETLDGLHFVAFTLLMLKRFVELTV